MNHKLLTRLLSVLTIGVTGMNVQLYGQATANPQDNIPVEIQVSNPPPLIYPSLQDISGISSFNYIKTQIPDVPNLNWPANNNWCYRQTTEYFDGLGRLWQSVRKNAHPDGHDIIQHHVYDNSGREVYQYLPFVKPAETSYGLFVPNVNTRMHQFYDQLGADEPPYSKTEYDNSPLERPRKSLSPGASWVGANRGVEISYGSNNQWTYGSLPSLPVSGGYPRWTISEINGALPVCQGDYGTDELYSVLTKDEDGKVVYEFTDKRGRLVLKMSKVNQTSSGIGLPSDYAYTCYVYDNLSRLRCIISPEAAKAIGSGTSSGYQFNWTLTQEQLDNLCFQYSYDARGRMIERKLPGKGIEYFVYDKRDRTVLYQDANLRASGDWKFTVFDRLDRAICTGIWEQDKPRLSMQGYIDNNDSYSAPDLRYFLKNYNLLYEYPSNGTAHILSYTYYDNYNQIGGLAFDPAQFSNITLPTDGTAIQSTLTPNVHGMVTGSKLRVKDPQSPSTEIWLSSASYYDRLGRVIQTVSENLKGGIEISSNIYSFQGTIWKNILRHNNPNARPVPGTTDPPHSTIKLTTTQKSNFKPAGGSDQVVSVTQQIDGGIVYQFANYFYDHLGRNVVKQTPAANTMMAYNIRGFLDKIDVRNTFENLADSVHIFEENLFYDKGFTSKLYNGNIAGITWKKAGNLTPLEAYGYSYDLLDRLGHAEYRRELSTNTWSNQNYDYTVSGVDYDLNGNIKHMNQRGIDPPTINSPITIDQLTYTYAPNSNKLIKVVDGVSAANTQSLPDFKDNANTASEEYGYDGNGNLTSDGNKQITIEYNHLNKPERISFNAKGDIFYVYDALGNKLQKRVYDKNTDITDTFDYIGNFVYKNDTLQYILNSEGRARPVPNPLYETKFVYDYFVKDHLGNVRSTVTAKPIDAQYLASHEISMANVEQLIFDNIPNVRDAKPGGDGMAAKLDGGDPNRRVGTAIMLKVMPGDRFTVSADAYYEGEYQQTDVESSQAVIESLASALLGGQTYAGIPLSELPENVRTITQTLNNPALAGQLENLIQSTNNNNAPRAHLNILFFNDKMEFIEGGSSVTQVPAVPQGGSLGGFITLTPNAQSQFGVGQVCCVSPGPGYAIIYVDNQTVGKDVWFDNIMIEHYTGKVQEESHYYPFGLTVKTWDDPNHKWQPIKFQSQKYDDEFGLNIYNFKWRDHDPQIGRFWQIDPLAEKYAHNSTYAFSENKVVVHRELEGLEAEYIFGKARQEVADAFQGLANTIDNTVSYFTKTSTATAIPSPPGQTTTVGTTATTTSQTNLGGIMSYLIGRNSNKGNPEPYFRTKTTISVDEKTDYSPTGEASVFKKTSVDNNGVVTGEVGVKSKVTVRKIPLTVSVAASQNTEGQTKATFQVSTGSSNTQGVGQVQHGNDGKKKDVSVGVGIQQKAGPTTTTTIFGLKFSW